MLLKLKQDQGPRVCSILDLGPTEQPSSLFKGIRVHLGASTIAGRAWGEEKEPDKTPQGPYIFYEELRS